MTTPRILRLRRTDAPDQHLLLQVSSAGSHPLDLKLIGTEHEHVYHGEIRERAIKDLQAAQYAGALEEWKSTLKHLFLQEPLDTTATSRDSKETSKESFEVVAAIKGDTVTLTIRQNVGGIAQRLGTITLTQDDEREAISPFDWVDTAVAAGDAVRNELVALQGLFSAQNAEIARLNEQLDSLVDAKKAYEEELLRKFVALINSKKLKIRNLQRIVQAANIEPAAMDQSKAEEVAKIEDSRAGKRKVGHDEDVEDGGDDDMVEDRDESEEGDAQESGMHDETPPRSDDDATDEDDPVDDAMPPTSSKPSRSGGEKNTLESQVNRTPAAEKMDIDEPLPPKRELPFAKKPLRSSRDVRPPPAQPEEADDTDDDEEL